MRRTFRLVLLAAVVAGCGEEGPTRAEAAGAVRAVDAYLTALAGRDYEAACARLSEAQRGGGDCAGTLDAGLYEAGADPDSREEIEPLAGQVIRKLIGEGRVARP